MDQYPAQPVDTQLNNPNTDVPVAPPPYQPPKTSPLKKILLIIIAGAFLLILISGSLLLFAGKAKKQTEVFPVRPTATPPAVPTIPLATEVPATVSASVSPSKTGRLAFIKDGDIYHSDFATFSLLFKNATPAADKLSFSPKGNYLAFRQKTETATPSALAVYNKEKKSLTTVSPVSGNGELVDYAFMPDETGVAMLTYEKNYKVSLYTWDNSTTDSGVLVNRPLPIKQIYLLADNTLVFSGSDGISTYKAPKIEPELIVPAQNILQVKLSPDGTKLLYSVGTKGKSDLYLVNTDGTNKQLLAATPAKVDMGKTGLTASVLNKGFIPYAVFFPKGDKLLVGFHYLTNLPLVGIYDLKDNSFTAVAPFYLSSDDIMTDEYRLLGARVVTTSSKVPFWQVSIFTLEDNSNLGVIRSIPQAHSPAFFSYGL